MQKYVTNNTLPDCLTAKHDAWNFHDKQATPDDEAGHAYRLDSLRVIEEWAGKLGTADLAVFDLEWIPERDPRTIARAVKAFRHFAGGIRVALYGQILGLGNLVTSEYVHPANDAGVMEAARMWAPVFKACGTVSIDAYYLQKEHQDYIAPSVNRQLEVAQAVVPELPRILWLSATWNGTGADLTRDEVRERVKLAHDPRVDWVLYWQPLVLPPVPVMQPMSYAVLGL